MHAVTPAKQAFGFEVQASPAVQALQACAESQNWFGPQLAPAALGAPSTQTRLPLVQAMAPAKQAFGFAVHASPAVQAPQTWAESQTWLVPQLAPAALGAPSAQERAPFAQAATPLKQMLGFEVQASPAVQALQACAESQNWFGPQLAPADLAAPSMHTRAPPVHAVTPSKHALEFVVQAEPATQALHAWAASQN